MNIIWYIDSNSSNFIALILVVIYFEGVFVCFKIIGG